MAHIQVLDKRVAELIAAGEVVERPASVVKELTENAVDAGASVITVEIRDGGVRRIRITDDGCGFEPEDVPVAFLRHATSKIRTETDLEQVGTLGFRGEALASVAAVARVELITRTAEALGGIRYVIEGGEETACEDIGCAKGSVITVSDLFYNVPARMKFLKKDVGEGNAVAAVVDRLALSHPEIAFRFVRDGREDLLTPGDGNLLSCIGAVLGREFAKTVVPVDYTLDGVRVHGYTCRPDGSRANRTMQHFFVNGRYVKTRTAMAALEQAYKGRIMGGRFPTCVLNIDLPPATVDANVHPAKVEVRFVNEKPVFDAVYHAIGTALASGSGAAVPRDWMSRFPAGEDEPIVTVPPLPTVPRAKAAEPVPEEPAATAVPVPSTPETAAPTGTVAEPAAPPPEIAEQPVWESQHPAPVRVLGEYLKTYILAEWRETLYIIDKHAAHERLLYNTLSRAEHRDAQQLLAPLTVSLGREEYAVLCEALPDLRTAGFDAEDFGGALLVRAVPMMLSDDDIGEVLREIAGRLLEGKREITTARLDWVYHSVACRAAVKAGNITTPAEWQQLAERVLWQDDIRTCPHGRPVCFALTRTEIEKQFGRIV